MPLAIAVCDLSDQSVHCICSVIIVHIVLNCVAFEEVRP